MTLGKVVAGALVGAAMLGIGSAKADTFVGTVGGNDCAGVFGAPFASCAIPNEAQYGNAQGSPIIIKFDFEDDGVTIKTVSVNSGLFPSISLTGSEFSFLFGSEGKTGSWTYTPGPGDPVITAYTAKGGNVFNVFLNDDGSVNSGSWTTPIDCGPPTNPKACGLSHLAFYDTGGSTPIPEPASLALLGMGLLGLGYAVRRRRG